jgi:hypothetical protein
MDQKVLFDDSTIIRYGFESPTSSGFVSFLSLKKKILLYLGITGRMLLSHFLHWIGLIYLRIMNPVDYCIDIR